MPELQESKHTESREKHLENQEYYRDLILKAYEKKFWEKPKWSDSKDYRALFFGYGSHKHLYEALAHGEEIAASAALIAAKFLGLVFKPPYPELCNSSRTFPHDVDLVDLGVRNFCANARKHYSKNRIIIDANVQDYYRSLVIRAYIQKFSDLPKPSHRDRKRAELFGYGSYEYFYEILACGRRIKPKAAMKAAEILGETFDSPKPEYSILPYGESTKNLSEEDIDGISESFCKKARKNYSKYGIVLDRNVQDYFRKLVVRAYIKKFSRIPSSSKTHIRFANFFGYASTAFFYECLARGARVKEESAITAADFLGEGFSPPSLDELNDKETEAICNHFLSQLEGKNSSKLDREIQNAWRAIVLKAYVGKFSRLPSYSRNYNQHANFFGYESASGLYNSLIGERRISQEATEIAANLLEVPFPPHVELSEERVRQIVEYFQTKAEKNYKKYGITPKLKERQGYFRSLVVRAYLKEFSLVPKKSQDQNIYTKEFANTTPKLFYERLVYSMGLEIQETLAQKAARVLKEKFTY